MQRTSISMIAAAIVIIIAVVLVVFKGDTSAEAGDSGVITPTKSNHSNPNQSRRKELDSPSNSKPDVNGKPDKEPLNAEIEIILAAIHEASIQYEPSQIPVIIPYLAHTEKEVRLAAVDGLIVLGERAAADHLREASKRLEDPREAVIFLDAADFLELPSYRFKREKVE
jgi:hypothetical protein